MRKRESSVRFLVEVFSFGIVLALLFLAVMVWWQAGDED